MSEPDIEATITYLTKKEGGRSAPVWTNDRPLIHYDGISWLADHEYPDVEKVFPGESAKVLLSFVNPEKHVGKVYRGMSFDVYELDRRIGYGTVMKILALEKNLSR